jgi:hypothetical protein
MLSDIYFMYISNYKTFKVDFATKGTVLHTFVGISISSSTNNLLIDYITFFFNYFSF